MIYQIILLILYFLGYIFQNSDLFDDRVVFLTLGSSTHISQSTDIEYIGLEFELSNFALIVYTTNWSEGRSLLLSISDKTDVNNRSKLYCETNSNQALDCLSGILSRGSYKCYCKRDTASTSRSNIYTVQGHVFK